jgi:hypothetical protein
VSYNRKSLYLNSVLQRSLAPSKELSSRPEKSWAFGPPKVMKNSFCSATTLNGSAALPFVISTGAQRSGEICGVSGPFLEMF